MLTNNLVKCEQNGNVRGKGNSRSKGKEDVLWEKVKSKFRIDFKKENLRIVAPYLWVKKRKIVNKILDVYVPYELNIQDVYMFISELIHIPSLLNDTAAIMKTFTKSNGVFIYLVDSANNQIYLCPKSSNNLENTNRISWNIQSGSTIPAYVALTKETVLVNNMVIEEKFQAFDWKDMTVTGVLCVPIVISDGSCYGIIELYRRNGIMYDQSEMRKIIPFSRLIATAIDNHLYRINLETNQSLVNYLLTLTRYYFTYPLQLPHLIHDIVHLAKDSLNSEHGIFYEYDTQKNELFNDVHGDLHDVYNKFAQRRKRHIQSVREQSIAEVALKTGTLINIKDAYNDSRFDQTWDIKTGLRTKTALCIPVNGRNGVLGILQLINKRHGFYIPMDEHLCKLFANYCVIAKEYENVQTKWLVSHSLNEVYNDCYFYQIFNTEIKEDSNFQFDATDLPHDFYEFKFYPTTEDELSKFACWIFRSLKIPDENYVNFIFSVRRGYRNNHYHNFWHAFSALHAVYLILKRHPDKFDDLEKAGFLIAAVCHDIDHRGHSNRYLAMIESPFAVLYDQSLMENHHYFTTMIILEQSSLKLKFSNAEFKIVCNYIKEMILATDLAQHFQMRNTTRFICDEIQKHGETVWSENINNRKNVRCLIMTAADLSGAAKLFEKNKLIVKRVMTEFFEEGAKIKDLGLQPLEIMDIKNIDHVPEFQIQFLQAIAVPCFELLVIIMPQTNELLENARALITNWKKLINVRDTLN